MRRVKWFTALRAAFLTIAVHDLGVQLRVRRQHDGAEVPAQQRVGYELGTDANLAVVQQETVAVIAVGAQLADVLFSLSELRLGHARQLRHGRTPACTG